MENIFFNAHHSPIGAFASFTLGFPGASGGLGLELGKPADQSVYIGIECEPNDFRLLPFCTMAAGHEAERFDVGQHEYRPNFANLSSFNRENITRNFSAGTDTWRAGDLTFRICSPVRSIPDPASASTSDLRTVLVPSVLCELTVDNTRGSQARRAVFGFKGNDPYTGMRILDDGDGRVGFGQGRHLAVVARGPGICSGLGFDLADILVAAPDNRQFGLGMVGALLLETPGGESRTFQIAVCFYRSGIITTGLDCSYYYTRLFKYVEEVGDFTLDHAAEIVRASTQTDARFAPPSLSKDQVFTLAHAVRGYYGSSQLLDHAGKALWMVNEGEYRMMNTFDLTVDHLFFELKMNPWVVRDVLDQFVERYSYVDQVRFPGSETLHPGGISFTHDMGVANVFSKPGYSSYEKVGIDGCFSYMTHEQLVNWLCCATTYAASTGDAAWTSGRLPVFEECLRSLINRDHPDPSMRNGVMGLDSTRAGGAAEITTYDSLDVSLGQARNNVYLAVKSWAAYVALEKLFASHGLSTSSAEARSQADRCAATIAGALNDDCFIPAVIGEGVEARIIPAIEGLIFPHVLGYVDALDPDGRFGRLIRALHTHFRSVLRPGVCLFDDGGWKLSSTSDNSWLSKIYLCQHVARAVLGVDGDIVTARADRAHVNWLLDEKLSYWAWSDQMVAGKAMGSKYYPRGVTAILWLDEA